MKNSLRHVTSFLATCLVIGIFFAFSPTINQAEAACRHIVNPPAAAVIDTPDLFAYATAEFFVPGSSSTCNDINIRNISLPNGSPTCAFFGVWFFPTNGTDYVNRWTHICTHTSQVDVPIATSVKTGTKYRVVVTSENGHPTSYYRFTVRD